MKNEINAAEQKKILSEKPLVLYGMGYIGKHISKWCDKNQIEYIFADKNADKKKSETRKRVIFPEELRNGYFNTRIMITSVNYYNEIKKYLNELGVEDKRILSYLYVWPEEVPWDELEGSANWDEVKKRAEIFATWFDESINSVTDYSYEKNFLKNFLRKGVSYYSPDYMRLEGNAPTAYFENAEPYETDAASCLAMIMSFRNPDEVISYMCIHTKKIIVVSYVPLENIADISLRRSINYNNDMTEVQFIGKFEKYGFSLIKKEPDPFDFVNVVYLFKK